VGLGQLWPSPIVTMFAAGLFAAMIWRDVRHDKAFAIGFLPFTIFRVSIFLALIAIEFGAAMPEIGREGRFVNAGAGFLLVMLGHYVAARSSFRLLSAQFAKSSAREPPPSADALRLLYAIAFACASAATLYLLAKGLQAGFPVFTRTDRFLFRLQAADYWFTWILGNALVLAGLLGVAFAFARIMQARLGAAGAMGAFLISMLLFGEKFFSILMMASVFMAPALLRGDSIRLGRGTVLLAGLAALAALAATWHIYSDYGRHLPSYTFERIASRVAAQGQLWYAASLDADLMRGDPQQLQQMSGLLWVYGGHQHAFEQGVGIFYLMRLYMPVQLWEAVVALRGVVTYTAGTEAYLVLTLGWLGGAAAVAFFGACFGAFAAYATTAFRQLDLVRIFLACKLLGYALDASIQASLWNVIGMRAAATIGAIVAYEIALRLWRAHRPLSPLGSQRLRGSASLP
jgi:hypothetical protein